MTPPRELKQEISLWLKRIVTVLCVFGAWCATADDGQIYCTPGDRFEVSLENRGWIYLGQADTKEERSVNLLERVISEDVTCFTFGAPRSGTFELAFQQQDNAHGETTEKTIRIHVAEEEVPTVLDRESDSKRYETADRLFAIGRYASAISGYLMEYDGKNGYVNDRLATLSLLTGSGEQAIAYWRRNLTLGDTYRNAAVASLVRVAIDRRQPESGYGLSEERLDQLLVELVEPLFAISDSSLEGILLPLARHYLRENEIQASIGVLEECLKRFPASRSLDEIYFLFGSCLERSSALRSIEGAWRWYERVCHEFPESPFAEASGERLRYMSRHFFLVR